MFPIFSFLKNVHFEENINTNIDAATPEFQRTKQKSFVLIFSGKNSVCFTSVKMKKFGNFTSGLHLNQLDFRKVCRFFVNNIQIR